MARAIWSGSIAFGLVNVPVKLYGAVRQKDVRFHQLHDADGVRIQMKRVCPADEEEVPYEHIVKGYEVAKDQYVIIQPEELEALAPEMTRTIDIEDFVDLHEIDPIYFEHAYYLAPDRGARKTYALLHAAMSTHDKVGIGRVVLRTKQYLCAIRPMKNVLSLTTLLYHDEVVAPGSIEELGAVDKLAKVSGRELELATQLVETLSRPFEPDRYRDEYRDRVLELIERKSEGEETVEQPLREKPEADVLDLMSALKASLDGEGGRASAGGGGRGRHRAAPQRRTSSGKHGGKGEKQAPSRASASSSSSTRGKGAGGARRRTTRSASTTRPASTARSRRTGKRTAHRERAAS